MDTLKKLWWLCFPIGYAAIAIITGIVIAANDGVRPIIGGLLWPVRLLIALLSG